MVTIFFNDLTRKEMLVYTAVIITDWANEDKPQQLILSCDSTNSKHLSSSI